jgi:hypothetical protein
MVVASVHNIGGLALDMTGRLRLLDGPGGSSAGPFAASLGTTLGIGQTEPVTVVLGERLPAGPWDAEITLTSGTFTRGAHATISFPVSGASVPAQATPTKRSSPPYLVISVAVVAGAAVALGGAGASLQVLRRRRL